MPRTALARPPFPARKVCLALLLAAGTWGLVGTRDARAQPSETRREYFTPGLTVETGARRGACDVLTFSADGKTLLAVGDDKVVHQWKLSLEKGLEPGEPLRWRTWHEARGSIYAMALSPGDNRYVAIGGQGMAPGAVAVLDRADGGKIRHSFTGAKNSAAGTIWSMGYSPTGRQVAYGVQDGTVWLWDLKDGKETEPRLLGRHKGGPYNYVRLVTYLNAQHLLSVDTNGSALRWPVAAPGETSEPAPLFRFDASSLYRVVLSPDRKWLVGVGGGGKGAAWLELRSMPDGAVKRFAPLPRGELPHNIAFTRDSKRLAVGVRLMAAPVKGANNFYKETTDKVYLCDPADPGLRLSPGPTPTYHPEALAFHPDGVHLAIAGGDDHETAVWDVRTNTRVDESRGPGSGLWAVALSPDARYLSFKEKRNRDPATPNDRGAGPWKVFDLQQRKWAPPNALKAEAPATEEGGWKILHSIDPALEGPDLPPLEKRQNGYIWFVQSPQGKIYELPTDRHRDWLPRCYAFLPAVKAAPGVPGRPVRLAVGHLWGVSLFDLNDDGPRLRRLMTGHEGEVMALALSADRRRLVSASRDETVAGWSLEDWPSHPELGASFFVRQGRLFVGQVDAGGPAWETGLSKGDELLLVVSARKILYNKSGKYTKKDVGTAAAGLAALEGTEPGKEIYLAWKRGDEGKLIEALTTVRQRPLWRFFPTRSGDWVLWRWRDYYYDTSTNGDYLIGWQRNYDDPYRRPEFYKAEQFRKEFHKPERVKAMLDDWKTDPARVAFLDLEPPAVTLEASAGTVTDSDLEVALTAVPRGSGENHRLTRVLLWVNDYLFAQWATPAELKLDAKGAFVRKRTIPRSLLRRGANLLTLQSYNQGDVRGEAKPVKVVYERPPVTPDLYGVFIGVSDYRKASPRLASLHAAEDAQAMFRLWLRRAGALYKKVHLAPPLLNGQATRDSVLRLLRELEGRVKPDDRLVFHLGGHGTRPGELQKLLKLPPARLKGLGSFLYCCADFDVERLRDTTVSFEELYLALVRLPCHKVLLLDTCHAGDTRSGLENPTSNPVRILTQDGVGPIILAACRPEESAYEEGTIDLGRTFGLFTAAIRRTLEERFVQADRNKNGALEPGELFAQVSVQVQTMLRQLRSDGVLTSGDQQNPIAFLPSLGEGLELVRREARR